MAKFLEFYFSSKWVCLIEDLPKLFIIMALVPLNFGSTQSFLHLHQDDFICRRNNEGGMTKGEGKRVKVTGSILPANKTNIYW